MKAEIVNNASQMCVKFSSLHLANKNQIFQSLIIIIILFLKVLSGSVGEVGIIL